MEVIRDETLRTLHVAHLFLGGELNLPDGSITNVMLAEGAVILASSGEGVSLVEDGIGPNMMIKDLAVGGGLSLSSTDGLVTVTNTGVLTVENTVSDFSTEIVANPGAGNLLVKQLIGGTNVSITSTDEAVTINASPGSAGVASVTNSPGVDIDLVTGTDSNPVIKQLTSSAGISLQDTGTSVTIVNTSPASSIGLVSEGGTSLVSGGVANNWVDCGAPYVTGSGSCCSVRNTSNLTITGNSFANNNLSSGIDFETAVPSSNISIVGNYIDNCLGGVTIHNPCQINNIIASNIITNCGTALNISSSGNVITGNFYSGNLNPSYIMTGNTIVDVDETASTFGTLQLNTPQTTFKSDVKSGYTTSLQTSKATAPWQAGSYTTPMIIYNPGVADSGAYVTTLTMGLANTGAALAGCVVELTAADVYNGASEFGTTVVYTSGPFTIPEATGSPFTNASTVITCNFPLTYYIYNLRIVTPGDVAVMVRYNTITGSTHSGWVDDGTDTALTGYDWDYSIQGYATYNAQVFLTVGEQGSNIGQFTLGAAGTPLSQITYYTATGTFPAVSANSDQYINIAQAGATVGQNVVVSTMLAYPRHQCRWSFYLER